MVVDQIDVYPILRSRTNQQWIHLVVQSLHHRVRGQVKPWFVEAGGLYVSIAHTEFPSKPSALVFVLIAPVAGMYCERPLVDAIYSVFEMNLMSSMFEDGSRLPSSVGYPNRYRDVPSANTVALPRRRGHLSANLGCRWQS